MHKSEAHVAVEDALFKFTRNFSRPAYLLSSDFHMANVRGRELGPHVRRNAHAAIRDALFNFT